MRIEESEKHHKHTSINANSYTGDNQIYLSNVNLTYLQNGNGIETVHGSNICYFMLCLCIIYIGNMYGQIHCLLSPFYTIYFIHNMTHTYIIK